VPALLVWVTPTLEETVILLAMGVMSGVAQSCTAYAYDAGEATFVSPFDYTRLLWAALAGWFIFSEPLGTTTLMGAAVIIGANAYIVRRQMAENRAAKAAARSD
jgi:drug/metabolite transporter (DMT)-like permease